MGRPDVDALSGLGFDPPVKRTTAREYERMRSFGVDDGHLEIAIKRRTGDMLPHDGLNGGSAERPP